MTPASSGEIETDSRNGYLDDVAHVLWPPPATVTRTRGSADTKPGQREFIVLPGHRRPTLLVPARPRRAAAGAIRDYAAPRTGVERARFSLLALGADWGLAQRVLRDRIRVVTPDPGTPTIDTYLSGVLGVDVSVALHVGPPRANRKPVLQVLSPAGSTIAFAKVGINALTDRLIEAEGDALDALGRRSFHVVRTPSLLHRGEWRGHRLLVTSAVEVRPRGRIDDALLGVATREIATCGETVQSTARTSAYWRDLRERVVGLPGPHGAAAAALLPAVESVLGQRSLRFGCWHGDWAPWNMTAAEHTVYVWDWERFGQGVPIGYDALHYRLQMAVKASRSGLRWAIDALLRDATALLAPLGVLPEDAGAVTVLYGLELASRYVADGQLEAGAAVGAVDAWLIPALAQFLSRSVEVPS